MNSQIFIERLDDHTAFLRSWSTLFDRTKDDVFFLSPVWIRAWLDEAASVSDLYSIRLIQANRDLLLGVVGVKKRTPPLIGLLPVHLHETGHEDHDQIYIEYNDFLLAGDAPISLRTKAISALADYFPQADEFVFRNVRSTLSSALEEFVSAASLEMSLLQNQHSYFIDLETIRSSDHSFVSSLSGNFGTKIRRAVKGYQSRGALLGRPAENCDAAWAKLIELHQESWRRRGGKGVFENSKLISFHQRLWEQAPDKCQLFEVTCNEETIGILYNFVHGDRVMNYQSGFKPESDNKLTPGFVSHALAAQYYADNGYAIYDMLGGDADYKQRLGKKGEELKSLVIRRPSLRNKVRKVIKSLMLR